LYPVLFSIVLATDYFVGDRSFATAALYSSTRLTFNTVLADWGASLWWTFPLVLLVLLPVHISFTRWHVRGGVIAVIVGGCAAAGLAFELNGLDVWTLIDGFIFGAATIGCIGGTLYLSGDRRRRHFL
jgi:hypothetical protein